MSLWRCGWWLDGSPCAAGMFASSQNVLVAGKYYFEVSMDEGGSDGTGGWGILFGVADFRMPLTGTVCVSINTPQGQGGCFYSGKGNNPTTATLGWGSPGRANADNVSELWGTSGVYGVKFNAIDHTLSFRNITNDRPASGLFSAETDIDTIIADAEFLHVMVGASHGGTTNKGVGTVNFGGSAFAGPVPSGYASIASVFSGAKLNSADNSNLVLSNGDLTFSGENVPVTFTPAVSGFTTNVGYSSSIRSNFLIALA